MDIFSSADLKFAFQLVEQDQPGIIFYTISKPDKNEWMAALTLLLTRRFSIVEVITDLPDLFLSGIFLQHI